MRRQLLTLFFGLALAETAWARGALGVPVPSGAGQQEPNRFRSPLGYRATIKWLERRLGREVRFRTMVDLPGVVAAHADAPRDDARWSGINVSRYGGHVWIFVIERQGGS